MSAEILSFLPHQPIDFENSANVRQSIKLEVGTGGWKMPYITHNRTPDQKRESRASILASVDNQLTLFYDKEATKLQQLFYEKEATKLQQSAEQKEEVLILLPAVEEDVEVAIREAPKRQTPSRLSDRSSQILESLDKPSGALDEHDYDESDARTATVSSCSSSSSSATPSSPASHVEDVVQSKPKENKRAKPTRNCMVRNEAWSDEDDDSHHQELIPPSAAPPIDQALEDDEDWPEDKGVSIPPPLPSAAQESPKETKHKKKSKKKKKKKHISGSTRGLDQYLGQSLDTPTSSSFDNTATPSFFDDTAPTPVMEHLEDRSPPPRLSFLQDQQDEISESDYFHLSAPALPLSPPSHETEEVGFERKERRSKESHNRDVEIVSPITGDHIRFSDQDLKSKQRLAEIFGDHMLLSPKALPKRKLKKSNKRKKKRVSMSEIITPPVIQPMRPTLLDCTDKQYSDQDLKSKERILEIFGDDHFLTLASPKPEKRKPERRTSVGSFHSRISTKSGNKLSLNKDDTPNTKRKPERRTSFGSFHSRISTKSGNRPSLNKGDDTPNSKRKPERRTSFGSFHSRLSTKSGRPDKNKQKEDQDNGSNASECRSSLGDFLSSSKTNTDRISGRRSRSSVGSFRSQRSKKSSSTINSHKKSKKDKKKKGHSKKNKLESLLGSPRKPLDDDDLIVEGVLKRYATDQCRSFSDHQEMAEAELISSITNTSPSELRRLKNKLTEQLRLRLGDMGVEEDASLDGSEHLIEIYEDDLSDVTSLTTLTSFTHYGGGASVLSGFQKSSHTLSQPLHSFLSLDNLDDDSKLVMVRDLAILNGKFSGTVCPISGEPQGQGRIEYSGTKGVYNGEWKQGQWSGKGKHTTAGGDYYEGQLLDNLYHGEGVFSYKKSGRFFEGQYVMGERTNGIMRYADGSVYKGQFYHGRRHGRGTYTFKDESRYKGDFYKDLMQGIGELRFRDGSCYIGEWKKGKHEGQGNMFSPDGMLCWSGMWEDGKQCVGMWEDGKQL